MDHFQKSILLNDNRAIYRSRFVLDDSCGSSTLRVAVMRSCQALVSGTSAGGIYKRTASSVSHQRIPFQPQRGRTGPFLDYNLGWNQRIGRKSFVRTTVFSRDREIPHEEVIPASECLPCNQSGHVRPVLFEGELYGAGVVWNQFIHHQVTLVTGYDFTQEENLFSLHWEHEGSAGLF